MIQGFIDIYFEAAIWAFDGSFIGHANSLFSSLVSISNALISNLEKANHFFA